MNKVVIFDMDGVIIDSEPLWKEAEIKVFKTVGVELTPAMCNETKGTRLDEVVNYWYRKFPWQNKTEEDIQIEVIAELKNLIAIRGQMMTGVIESLEFFKSHGFKIGLASSSLLSLIEHVLATFNIRHYFDEICSAEHEEYGKPHPAVYLTCARKLNTPPHNCIVIEDSATGMISALAANMKVIAIPAPEDFSDQRFLIANLKLESLNMINQDTLHILK